MDLNVFLCGGGTRLAAYLGALRDIEERGGRVTHWAGSSAGALLAAVLACGYSHQQALNLLMKTDFRQFLDFRPAGVLRRYGIYAGKRLENWLNTALEQRQFKDLRKPLSVIALDIEAARPFVFSKELTPDAHLATAVRCSVGIPGVFAIRRYTGRTLVDGALAQIEESNLFPDLSSRPLVTIRLVRDRPARTARSGRFGLAAYVTQVASIMLDAIDQARVAAAQWKNTLLIDTGPYSSINFELSRDDKQTLYRMGYDQSRKYLDLQAISSKT